MWLLIAAIIFILLIISLITMDKEKERSFWLKILFVYMSFLISLNFGSIKIPIMILITYEIIKRKSKLNKKLKYITLLFSLVLFISINYVFPPIPFNYIGISNDIYKGISNFKVVKSVQKFSPDSPVQSEIQQYSESDTNLMFRAFVLNQKNIPIQNGEWLTMQADIELDFYWISQSIKGKGEKISENEIIEYSIERQEYLRFNKTGEEYLGIFKMDKNGKFYLDYIIEGKFDQNQRPKSLLLGY